MLPGDAWVTLFAGLEADGLNQGSAEAQLERLTADPGVLKVADDARRHVERYGSVEGAMLNGSLRDRLGALLGVDMALIEADPARASGTSPGLIASRARYEAVGRFNELADGMLVPRRSYPARPAQAPERLAEYLDNAVWIPPERAKAIQWTAVDALDDLDVGSDITVCAVPFIDEHEIELVLQTRASVTGYTANLSGSVDWVDRVRRVLEVMDLSDSEIGLVPELALSVDLLQIWIDAIRSTPAATGRLRWVLVGTGDLPGGAGPAELPSNTAYLLSRLTGRIIATQEKRHGFTLSERQSAGWPPASGLGPGPHRELIQVGDTLTVLESSSGRFAISICEDLGRQDSDELIRATSVSHLLAPIFAPPFELHSWAVNRAVELATFTGSSVAAFTSYGVVRKTYDGSECTLATVQTELFSSGALPANYPAPEVVAPSGPEVWRAALRSMR